MNARLQAGQRSRTGLSSPTARPSTCWSLRPSVPWASVGQASCGTAKAPAACCRLLGPRPWNTGQADCDRSAVGLRRKCRRQPCKHVQGVGHATVGRIFDRDEPVVRMASVDLLEHGRNAANGNEFHALAESMDRRQMAIAIGRTQVCDSQILFQPPATRLSIRGTRPERSDRPADPC